jgi:PAS domain S-box-containing protein
VGFDNLNLSKSRYELIGGFSMTEKPTYHELEQRVKELEAFEAKREEKVVALEQLFDLSLDMLCVADMNAYFKHINNAFEKTLGYTKEELFKESFLHFIHPSDIASTIAEVEKLSLGEPTIYFENRYRCKDNSYKWLAWTSMPNLEHGLMYAVARDITEHKVAAQALFESEERYRLLFNSMLSGFALHEIIYDKNGKPCDYRFLDLNPAFERLTGLRRIDILGKRVREVLPKIETFWINTYGEVVLSGKPVHFENYIEELDRYYEVVAFRPQKNQFAVTFTDITARIRSEEGLRESEERYRLLADNIRDVIWLRDMNLNLKYISPSVMSQRGYTVEEAMALKLEENWTPDSFKKVREVFLEELEIEKNKKKDMNRSRTIEIEANCKGGSTIWTEAKMTFLRDKDGEPIGIIGATRDITERKEAKEALKERTIRLEIEKKSLAELNTAMKVLLEKREADKSKLEEYVLANVKRLIEPYFEKIKKTKLNDQQGAFLRIIESNLNEIISPFTKEVSLEYFNLTSTELQIAKKIRQGYTTKKIAAFMNISPRTVETHRKNIRRKIGLEGKKANLRSHLLSIN